MSITPNVELFTGASWPECQAFVRNIRTVAWKEGRLRDGAWMADAASMFFADEALRWHSELPLDIRQDWFKLEAALVKEWYPSIDGPTNNLRIQPTPAAAPPSGSIQPVIAPKLGVLKVVLEGSSSFFYLETRGQASVFPLTAELSMAVRLRSDPSSSPQTLEILDESPNCGLAIHWVGNPLRIGRGSRSSYARVTRVERTSMKSSCGSEGPFQVAVWDLAPNGEITIQWSNGDIKTPLIAFVTSHQELLIVADVGRISGGNPEGHEGRLIFEPTS